MFSLKLLKLILYNNNVIKKSVLLDKAVHIMTGGIRMGQYSE